MVNSDTTLWTEKFRPQKFDDIKGHDEIVKRVRGFVNENNMPHMLFSGPAGVGKTSTALVIAKELYGEDWKQNFLELNASDERGIDVVRNNVKDFARTKSIGDVPFKIIYLDESDALTQEAQQALRRTMEQYTKSTRFILSCNYSSKIIDPIQSRCAVFHFKRLGKEEVFKIIEDIEEKENLSISEKAKEAVYNISDGDCRRVENILQSSAVLKEDIDEEVIYSIASAAKPEEVKAALKLAINNKFTASRERLLDTMLEHGLSGLDIIKQIQSEIWDLNISDKKKVRLIEECGEIEFRMTEGSDEFVQLEAFLATVVKIT